MASDGRLGLFRRNPRPAEKKTFTVHSMPRHRAAGPWALASSAARLDAGDKQEAKVQRMLRQGWQGDAWNYRDMIGELRYAIQFLANCTARMRVFPAMYPVSGEADAPVPISEAEGIPDPIREQLISSCARAMSDLGNGRMAISGLLHRISTNKSVAGEWYLLGRTDPQTGLDTWSARSVDELVVYDETWHLREIPDDRQNSVIPWIKLDPQLTVISRVWTPHPRFELYADSAMKAMLDDCESVMILRRMIRATGRSRLASRGLLLVPDELDIKVPVEDDDDPEADPFMSALANAMMAPIENEGTADGVVPIVIRGPGEQLDKLKLIDLATSFDEQAAKTRAELIGVIATTLDLPKEVIMGVADLNHWTAWQVDDNTFRHHVEPHVIGCCDDLSGAYLRPYLLADNIPDAYVERCVLWYDPVELVTHPDRTKDAETAHAAFVISDKAYRDAAGFSDEDAPTIEELERRRVQDIRALPLNLLMEYARRADPTLVVPPITQAGEVPGIKPGGVDVGSPILPGPAGPAASAPGASSPPADSAATGQPGPPPADRPAPAAPSITAAGGEPNTGVMIALYPPADLAASWALPGGEAPGELHVTLAFLGQASDLPDPDALKAAVQEWASSTAPISGEISGVGLFTAGEDPVTYLSPDLPALPAAREQLMTALQDAGQQPSQEHGFTPHITLDYADRVGDVDASVGGTQIAFAAASVVIADDRTDYPFNAAVTACARTAVSATSRRLSRRLLSIDAELRARLQTAANAAMLRQLERAGAKLRTKVAKDETMRTRIAQRANERVAAILGPEVVTAAGLSSVELIGHDWSALRSQFHEWTSAAQAQALQTALRISGVDAEDAAASQAQQAMDAGRDAAWDMLSHTLTSLGHHLLYNPDPNAGPGDWAGLNPNSIVPAGTIRAALAVAGGSNPTAIAVDHSTGGVGLLEPVGQIGTGSTIGDLITSAGGQVEGYEWVHGPSLNPFTPHEDLDGVEFHNFDDPSLQNTGDFPDNQYYMPGDHDGCVCDFMPIYLSPEEE